MPPFDEAIWQTWTRLARLGCWRLDCSHPSQALDWDELCHNLHGTEGERFHPSLGETLLMYQDESRAGLEEALMNCSLQGKAFEVEVELLVGQGELRRLLVAGCPLDQGRQILGYYQDISQRHQLWQSLRSEQRHARAIFRALADVLISVDGRGTIRQVHSLGRSQLAWAQDISEGKALGEIFPGLRTVLQTQLRQACDKGEALSCEFPGPLGVVLEARLLPLEEMETRGSRLREVPEAICSVLVMIRDVSEQHRRSEQIRSAQEAAIQASRMKSQFLANMSHEIRTPLNGIIGMTELILQGDLSPELRENAQTALRSAQLLLETVSGILDLSKIEANRLELETIPFSPRSLVHDSLAALALRAHEKGLELLGAVDSSVPAKLVGDPTRIRQVINNLLSNAIKFTGQGEVELKMVQREPGLVKVSVFDTGEGVAYARQRDIFEAFTQADGSTTRRFGGTGLGLTIAKQMVEKMGGKIWLESQPGQGSRFSFTMRLANYHSESSDFDSASAAFSRDLESTTLSRQEFEKTVQGRRILIVDDNASSRRLLKEKLSAWGIESQVALGAGPAVQLAREAQRLGRPFDGALIDLQMPGCDGLELSRVLPPGLTRILMVALVRPRAEELREAGLEYVLTKPILGQELASILLKLCRAQSPPVEVSPASRQARALRVLIAEDNSVNAQVVSKMLQRLGHQVVHVVNGQLALTYLGENSVDVVLMDVQMPVMDGLEATRRWRTLEASGSKRLPIVALTGNALASDRDQCFEAGMDLHLTKPIRLDLLDRMLNSLPLDSLS